MNLKEITVCGVVIMIHMNVIAVLINDHSFVSRNLSYAKI